MKALSLMQPWASLVAIGAKRIETRRWATVYRGPLAIHASAGFPTYAKGLCFEEPFFSALSAAGLVQAGVWPPALPLGVVVATCELVDCVKIARWAPSFSSRLERSGGHINYHQVEWQNIPPDEPEHSFGDFTAGRYAWVLENVQALAAPVPAKGRLGLWEWGEHSGRSA